MLQEFVSLRYLSYRESLLYSNFITFFLLFLYSNNRAIQPGDSPYLVVKDSIAFTESSFDVHLLNKKSNVLLNLKLQTLQKNTARFRITEVNPIRPRYEVKDVLIKEPVTIRWGLTYMHYNIDQAWGQDSWILAKLVFAFFISVNKNAKKGSRPIFSHLDWSLALLYDLKENFYLQDQCGKSRAGKMSLLW